MGVTVLSIVSLILSFTLSMGVLILKNNHILWLDKPIFRDFARSSLVQFLMIISLFTYRTICHFPKSLFYSYVVANFGIIVVFYFARLHIIMHTYIGLNNKSYFVFFLLFIISSIFAITRMFFRVGYIINETHIVNTVFEQLAKQSVGFFSTLGKRVSGNIPTNPGVNGTDRHFVLGVGTFCATAVAAGSGVYLGYEAYQTRQINLRMADSAERGLDMQERNSGHMSKNTYDQKWDEFGRRRK